MKYYTVEARSVNGESVKIFRGIKSRTAREAMEYVKSITSPEDHWEMRYELSKHYKDRKWTPGRERHEVREQNRSLWALLAKHADRRHFTSIKKDEKLFYRLVMTRFSESWNADVSRILPESPIERIFGEFTEILLHGEDNHEVSHAASNHA